MYETCDLCGATEQEIRECYGISTEGMFQTLFGGRMMLCLNCFNGVTNSPKQFVSPHRKTREIIERYRWLKEQGAEQ